MDNVTDAEVLAPETSLPVARVDHAPEAVNLQWRKANAGLLEIVRFGAMLVEIDSCLKRQTAKQRNQHSEISLKGWLEQHCPDINYKSAMGYKVVAEQMRDRYKVPAKLPLTLALPQADGSIEVCIPEDVKIEKSTVEQFQREFYGMCEGKSMYQLTLDLGLREPKPRGGDRRSKIEQPKLTERDKLELQQRSAAEYFDESLKGMLWQVESAQSHLLLNAAQLTQAITRLRVIADALKDANKEI